MIYLKKHLLPIVREEIRRNTQKYPIKDPKQKPQMRPVQPNGHRLYYKKLNRNRSPQVHRKPDFDIGKIGAETQSLKVRKPNR